MRPCTRKPACLLLTFISKNLGEPAQKNQCEIVRGRIRFAVDLPAPVTNGLAGLTCLQELLEQMRVSA